MSKAFIGTSGYLYNHWLEVFYPKEIKKDQWLEYYARFFDTVELNVTFYRLPQESVFVGWYKRTPDNFKFTIKGSRFITHIKKLNEVEEPLKLFFEHAKNLKEKFKVTLWQFPPNFKADLNKLETFCRLLKNHSQNCHKSSLERKIVTKQEPEQIPLRHVFEFRHESWFCDEVYQILRKYNMALVICDYPFNLKSDKSDGRGKSDKGDKGGKKIIQVPETADFIYLRRHGTTALYASNYSDEQLKQDAAQIKNWLNPPVGGGKDVYVYFNNDALGHAVKNALKLKEIIGK